MLFFLTSSFRIFVKHLISSGMQLKVCMKIWTRLSVNTLPSGCFTDFHFLLLAYWRSFCLSKLSFSELQKTFSFFSNLELSDRSRSWKTLGLMPVQWQPALIVAAGLSLAFLWGFLCHLCVEEKLNCLHFSYLVVLQMLFTDGVKKSTVV